MREYYQTNGGSGKGGIPNKKNKGNISKLQRITDDIRNVLLRKYLLKRKTEFNINFTEYRLALNPHNFGVHIYTYLEKQRQTLK